MDEIEIKFKIGQEVRERGKSEKHTVIGFMTDMGGVTYKVSSKEVDVQAKELVEGVSFYKEEELEAVK